MPQMESGKAFEYSILKEFKEKLDNLTNVDWKLSFRIHNASSRIEPSLKFDINLLKAPNSLFTNSLSVSHGV